MSVKRASHLQRPFVHAKMSRKPDGCKVDDGTGFVQKRSKKHTVNGVETRTESAIHHLLVAVVLSLSACDRDAQYMYGLRLIVDSSGIGRQISLASRLQFRSFLQNSLGQN